MLQVRQCEELLQALLSAFGDGHGKADFPLEDRVRIDDVAGERVLLCAGGVDPLRILHMLTYAGQC